MLKPPYALLSVVLLFNTAWLHAQTPASTTFQTNNLRAVVNANGVLFNDFQQGQLVPIQPGLPEKTLLRSSGLWVTGIDQGGNLHGAVQSNDQSDFHSTLFITNDGIAEDYIWRVNCTDINAHLADFGDNGQIDAPNPAVFRWPGNGNFQTELTIPYTIQGAAGFYDNNANNVYEPAYGDYPVIETRGCFENDFPKDMGWFVSDDIGGSQPHLSGLMPLQLEVQTQVFAFQVQPNSVLNNTIFVRYKLINRGGGRLNSCYMGLFNDFSIGNDGDDFVGVDPARNIVYAYNGDGEDEGGFGNSAPVMAMDMLRGPVDTFGNEMDFRHFVVLENTADLHDSQFQNILTGHFPDGSGAPNNGMMYPGNPNNLAEISEVSLGNTPGHRVGVASVGPFILNPGAVNEFFVAYYYVYTPGNAPLQNVQTLYDQAAAIPQDLFDNCFAMSSEQICDVTLEAPQPFIAPENLLLYPSPTNSDFTVESKGAPFSRIDVSDMLGRLVQRVELDKSTQKYTIATKNLSAGLYVVRVGGQVLTVAIQ